MKGINDRFARVYKKVRYGDIEYKTLPDWGTDLREENYLYIDKTEYVYNLTHSNSSYIFFSRPRRFGKSLLISTLQCYFEGRKELFKGLAIEQLEKEWIEYPVLHFDMSKAKHLDVDKLNHYLSLQLYQYEQIYGADNQEREVNERLEGVIKKLAGKQGKKWRFCSMNTMPLYWMSRMRRRTCLCCVM